MQNPLFLALDGEMTTRSDAERASRTRLAMAGSYPLVNANQSGLQLNDPRTVTLI
jgi:hypothetical protein